MPVEDVELVVGHGGNDLLDGGQADEVPGRVDQQTPVDIGRLVRHLSSKHNLSLLVAWVSKTV